VHVCHLPDLNHYGLCPNCGANWDNGDIFEALRAQAWTEKMSDDELRQLVADSYGPPRRFSRLIGVEIPDVYDGVSFWACPDCHAKWAALPLP
jgi:rubredoxin